jgi:hypothetical protein
VLVNTRSPLYSAVGKVVACFITAAILPMALKVPGLIPGPAHTWKNSMGLAKSAGGRRIFDSERVHFVPRFALNFSPIRKNGFFQIFVEYKKLVSMLINYLTVIYDTSDMADIYLLTT